MNYNIIILINIFILIIFTIIIIYIIYDLYKYKKIKEYFKNDYLSTKPENISYFTEKMQELQNKMKDNSKYIIDNYPQTYTYGYDSIYLFNEPIIMKHLRLYPVYKYPFGKAAFKFDLILYDDKKKVYYIEENTNRTSSGGSGDSSLNSSTAWRCDSDNNDQFSFIGSWNQINRNDNIHVHGIVITRNYDKMEYTNRFILIYSEDNKLFTYIPYDTYKKYSSANLHFGCYSCAIRSESNKQVIDNYQYRGNYIYDYSTRFKKIIYQSEINSLQNQVNNYKSEINQCKIDYQNINKPCQY